MGTFFLLINLISIIFSKLDLFVVSKISSSQYYLLSFVYRFKVIGRSVGLEDLGSVQLHLVISLFIAWAFTVLAVIKGVKTLGKV